MSARQKRSNDFFGFIISSGKRTPPKIRGVYTAEWQQFSITIGDPQCLLKTLRVLMPGFFQIYRSGV
jgi:hypothetical protein